MTLLTLILSKLCTFRLASSRIRICKGMIGRAASLQQSVHIVATTNSKPENTNARQSMSRRFNAFECGQIYLYRLGNLCFLTRKGTLQPLPHPTHTHCEELVGRALAYKCSLRLISCTLRVPSRGLQYCAWHTRVLLPPYKNTLRQTAATCREMFTTIPEGRK